MTDLLIKNYFSSSETSCKCGCGMDIDPDFRQKLNILRSAYGKPMKITSGARCESHNKKIGGAPLSKHVEGIAVDISTTSSEEVYTLVKLALEHNFSGIGIHKNFLHLDNRQEKKVLWLY